jgi:hypothetical protein
MNRKSMMRALTGETMRFAAPLAIGIVGAAATLGSAQAAPITFTWNPGAVGLTANNPTPPPTTIPAPAFTATNIDAVADFADITINPTTNTFTENAAIRVDGLSLGGVAVNPLGLGTTYSLFAVFHASGTGSIPGTGMATVGAFTKASYTFFASPKSDPTITLNPGGTPTITGITGAFALFGGTLVHGSNTLTNTSGFFSPTANLTVTLTTCSAAGQLLPGPAATNSNGVPTATCAGNESAFFVTPPPNKLAMAINNFSATTSETTLTKISSTVAHLDINGGGGNITFTVVPEPTSLALLGSGLFALGAMGRRRRRR